MNKKLLFLGLLLSSMIVNAETGQQRLRRLKEQESTSIKQKIKDSDLNKDLNVLDRYFQQVDEKIHNQEAIAPLPLETLEKPLKRPVKKIQKKVVPTIKESDKKRTIRVPTDVEKLFLKAKQQSGEATPNSSQSDLKFRGRDPFAITEEMVRGDASLQASLSFLPDDKPKFTVPAMTIKGLVMGEDDMYVAVLDIEGYGSKVVRKGDTIGLQGSGGDAAIRIKEITRLQIIVEAGKVGKVIVVR